MQIMALISLAILLSFVRLGRAQARQDELTAPWERAVSLERCGNCAAAEQVLVSAARAAAFFNDLGAAYHFQDKYLKAEWAYRRAVALCRTACGSEPILTMRFTANLANLYLETGQYPKAERLQLGSLAARIEASGQGDPDVIRLTSTLGTLAMHRGRYAEAERTLQDALARWEEVRSGGLESLYVLNNLGILYQSVGRNDDALSYCERAMEVAEKVLRPGDPLRIKVWLNVGSLRLIENGPADAQPYFQTALEISEKALGQDHPLVGWILGAYAVDLRRMHRKTEAKAMERRAKTILQSTAGSPGEKYAIDSADIRRHR